jgi:RNA polymerase sigma-70 factor (ECF subfamily)
MSSNESAAIAELNNEAPKAPASETLDYLMRRFGDQVMRLAYYHVRDRFLAEDIFQEVFCRVYLNLDKFRNDSSYFTWIYRITVNLCQDYKASAYFRRMLPWYNMELKPPADTQLFESAEGGDIFAKVMELPQKYRTVIALYYFDELTSPEIAARLGISEAAVRTRLSRGRDMLRSLLAGEANDSYWVPEKT